LVRRKAFQFSEGLIVRLKEVTRVPIGAHVTAHPSGGHSRAGARVVALNAKVGDVLWLNHSNFETNIAVATPLYGNGRGYVYTSCCTPISCSPRFINNVLAQLVAHPPIQDHLHITNFSSDIISLLFLLLNDKDFLNLRITCRSMFAKSVSKGVRARVLYLVEKRWNQLIPALTRR
jgi:hypothetical protein